VSMSRHINYQNGNQLTGRLPIRRQQPSGKLKFSLDFMAWLPHHDTTLACSLRESGMKRTFEEWDGLGKGEVDFYSD
jgi:hypothetical protein